MRVWASRGAWRVRVWASCVLVRVCGCRREHVQHSNILFVWRFASMILSAELYSQEEGK